MADESRKEPFVPQGDRPEVKLKPDTPLSELRVRDLAAIIGAATKSPFEVGKTPLKDFFDKPFPEEAKDFIKELKPEKFEKNELKELKGEKLEKHEKIERSRSRRSSRSGRSRRSRVTGTGLRSRTHSWPRPAAGSADSDGGRTDAAGQPAGESGRRAEEAREVVDGARRGGPSPGRTQRVAVYRYPRKGWSPLIRAS